MAPTQNSCHRICPCLREGEREEEDCEVYYKGELFSFLLNCDCSGSYTYLQSCLLSPAPDLGMLSAKWASGNANQGGAPCTHGFTHF